MSNSKSDKYICGGPLWAIFVSFNPRCSVASQTQTTMSSPEGAATTRSSSEATVPTTQSPEFNAEKHLKGGTKDFRFVPIPKRLQYDSTRPFQFTTVLNITFGFASTFSEYSKCLRVGMTLTCCTQLLLIYITVNLCYVRAFVHCSSSSNDIGLTVYSAICRLLWCHSPRGF